LFKRCFKRVLHITTFGTHFQDRVVVVPEPFLRKGVRRNSSKTQQSGQAPRSETEVKNRRSSVKDGAPRTIQKVG